MMNDALRTARYLRTWLTGRPRVRVRDVVMRRGDASVPATVLEPSRDGSRPLSSWIVLHGVTRPGREHAQLRRFARALAASRAVVVIPAIPEWIELDLSTKATLPTVQGALDLLDGMPRVAPGRTALVGFSFGSPQAILSGADPSVRHRISGIVGFGGYCDLERTVRFQLTGVHEWNGTLHRTEPDPYGRWIVGANFLSAVPGYEDAGEVGRALWTLAAGAGDRQIPARDPSLIGEAEGLRRDLRPDLRGLFDLFAPPDGRDPEPEDVEDLVVGLTEAGRRASPLLDPSERFAEVEQCVHILHGRGDRLIPYTEALRMEERLERAARGTNGGVRCTVTALFAHSRGDDMPAAARLVREGVMFAGALADILGAPDAGAG